jgi:hypothetical protein
MPAVLPGKVYRAPEPLIIPDIRVHFANWSKYKSRTGVWPATSVFLFEFRFIFVASVMVFALYLGRHNFYAGTKRVAGAILLVGVVGYFCASFFVLAHQSRYIPIAVGSSIYAFSLWQHEYGRACLGILAVTIFSSLWATIEITTWNRELQSRHLSSGQDVWDVTQFPADQN